MTDNKKYPKYLNLRGFLCFQILHKLSKKALCGDVLAMEIGGKKFGKLTPGTIYPALKVLRDRRLVQFKTEGRKKIYHLTKRGLGEYKISKRLFKRIFKELF
ncbi:MAG: PadR family transcriptional regulator [Nanoarchaeota archaeon]|nr:PadR family transcriptional regulator [Nanoarchaeota archaeon]